MIMMRTPVAMLFRRPRDSPMMEVVRAPRKHPTVLDELGKHILSHARPCRRTTYRCKWRLLSQSKSGWVY